MTRRRPPVATLVRVALAAAGLATIAWMVQRTGVARLHAILAPAAPYLPLAAALEGVRIACDAFSTRQILGAPGRTIPKRTLYAAQVAAHGVMGVMPAGRSASEAAKAMLLSPWLGPEAAVAMGTTNQANVLVSSSLFSIACLGFAWQLGAGALLVSALAVHVVVLFFAGLGMRVGTTHPRIEGWLRARWPRFAERMHAFHAASRGVPLVALAPLGTMVLGRTVQTVQYAVLARAVGIDVGLPGAFAVQGVNLVAAMLGVFVPGQLGSSELVFAAAADALGTDAPRAMSVALLAHALQLGWISVGLLVLLTWRARAPVQASFNGPVRSPPEG